jgi:hypothetical protein
MIRPLTIVTFMLACGSGLYLYQSKHEAQVLYRAIEKTIHDTSALREQSRLLAAEWTMLNDPETLRKFSDTYLSLKSIAPTQFTSLADLDSRLPAVRIEAPPPTPSTTTDDDESAPAISEATPPAVPVEPAAAVAADEPKSRPAPVVASTIPQSPPHPAKVAIAKPAAPTVTHAVTSGPEQHGVEARVADARQPAPASDIRPARPAEVRTPVRQAVAVQPSNAQSPATQPRPTVLASAPRPLAPSLTSTPGPVQRQYSGSLLGMARGAASPAPLPRPIPVSAAQWSNTN